MNPFTDEYFVTSYRITFFTLENFLSIFILSPLKIDEIGRVTERAVAIGLKRHGPLQHSMIHFEISKT